MLEAMNKTYDAIIVGAGPAGLTAATYLRRFHRDVLVIHNNDSRAEWIPESNNCPGFPQGVTGTQLLARMKCQAEAFDTPFIEGTVERLEKTDTAFNVIIEPGTYNASRVILATGMKDRLPEVTWVEDAVAKHAMRLCSICDAYEASDQRIGVYGRLTDIASHGTFLRSYSAHVHLIPSDADDVDHPKVEEAREAGVHVHRFGGELGFDGESCFWRNDEGQTFTFHTVYPFMGSITTAQLAADIGAELTDTKEMLVDKNQMTTVDGLYAIGDVVSGLNQISVAVGQAAVASCHLHNALPRKLREEQPGRA